MAEHFLSLVEHLVFSIFMPILTKANYCSDGNKQTNKKKSNFKITLLNDLFFSIFMPILTKANYCSDGNKQTNKKKNNFQITLLNNLFFSVFHPNFGIHKKSINVLFFSIFVPKPFGERCCCCSLRHFIATNVFAFNVCFCSKAFLLLLKKEKFTCADKTFFCLVLGTRVLDKQIKNIFFR